MSSRPATSALTSMTSRRPDTASKKRAWRPTTTRRFPTGRVSSVETRWATWSNSQGSRGTIANDAQDKSWHLGAGADDHALCSSGLSAAVDHRADDLQGEAGGRGTGRRD